MSKFKVNDLVVCKSSGRFLIITNVAYGGSSEALYFTKPLSGEIYAGNMWRAEDLELFTKFSVGDLVKDRLTYKKMIVTKIIDNDNIKCRFEIENIYHSYIFNRSELYMHEDSQPHFLGKTTSY